MNWSKNLPDECPPKEAFEPKKFKIYRFIKGTSLTVKDLQSQRVLQPSKIFRGVDECVTRSLSVYSELETCRNMLKLPANKNRWQNVAEIELSANDGLIMKTFGRGHYSWWRSDKYDLKSSQVVPK
jgi:hypothetical protein